MWEALGTRGHAWPVLLAPSGLCPLPLAQGQAAQDNGSGGSCPAQRAGAAATTRRGRPSVRLCLRRSRGPGPQGEGAIVRPELGTAAPEARRNPRVAKTAELVPESAPRRQCPSGGDCFNCGGAFY